LLDLAGAKPHPRVRASCSNPMGGPSRIASADLTFDVLVPEASVSKDQGSAPVHDGKKEAASTPGVWKQVDLSESKPFDLQAGDCELVEQFGRDILPLFTTRNVVSDMRCIPHQETLGGIRLRFEVFTVPAVPKQPKPERLNPKRAAPASYS
jgi:hypothetical protein